MKAFKKMVIVLILALVAVSAVNLLAGSVSAASSLGCSASVSAKSNAVGADTSLTIVISNIGTANIGSMNVTVPSAYTEIGNLAVSQATGWTATLQSIGSGSKITNFILLYGSTQPLIPGQGITLSFTARNPLPDGTYKWTVGINGKLATTSTLIPQSVTETAFSAVVINSMNDALFILIIALVIAFANTALNRVLINYFIGWEQYRVMQKEMNEYRQETMAAARANDKKQMEKLKKRQSQINSMQAKMLKPQMVQLAISFVYIVIWIWVLIPTYETTSLVYLPGIGALPVVYWYPIASFFLGLLASRLLGIMPIEP